MLRTRKQSRYTLSLDVKAHAPLITALDKYQDATGPFAKWLENKNLVQVYSRYGSGGYPLQFYYDSDKWDWRQLEKDYLTESKLLNKAERFLKGKAPFNLNIGALVFEFLKFTPVLYLLWFLSK
jgi:hypothetical protein